MSAQPCFYSLLRLFAWLTLLTCSSGVAHAQPLALNGKWFSASPGWRYAGQSMLDDTNLVPVSRLRLTGGHFLFQADFDIRVAGAKVLDFKNSSVIGLFHHRIFDDRGRLVFEAKGGIQSPEDNRFFLRHGRELNLPQGHYRLITELTSPFFLAQPQPYFDLLQDYRKNIRSGNALTLICIGILFGLIFYYGVISLVRRSAVNALYALFILTNLLYNMTALLVFPDLFGLHYFYLISFPFLLLGNWVYIAFVIGLLNIRRDKQPILYGLGAGLIGLFTTFTVLGFIKPNWSLELVRMAVGLYMLYGVVCGIVRMRQGCPSAPFYLIAVGAFFAMGMTAISLNAMDGTYTFYIEHLGLLAITVEAMLLSFVLAQQFVQLRKEKEQALSSSLQNLHAACTDALTGLPNRYALEHELQQLPAQGSLTFIDMDGLKYYNDQFGHARGDALLRSFGRLLQQKLPEQVKLHRLGGDEFAITHPQGNLNQVESVLQDAVDELRDEGFELTGASFGSVHVFENPAKDELMRIADSRMYQCKRTRKEQAANQHAGGRQEVGIAPMQPV